LVRQLLQYKRFKEAAGLLSERASDRRNRFARLPVDVTPLPRSDGVEKLLEAVSIWDVLSAYAEVVRQVQMARPQSIVYDDVPVSAYMEEIVGRLQAAGGSIAFLGLFVQDRSRSRVIGLFLAILELVRCRRIRVDQAEADRSGGIELHLMPPRQDTPQARQGADG